jgi:hypothetical protein
MANPRPEPNPASAKEKAEGSRDHVSDEASRATEARVDEATPSNLRKDPDEWKTGDERMTDAQKSYLKTMSDEAGEPFDETLTKAEASKRIEELQQKTGRGGGS